MTWTQYGLNVFWKFALQVFLRQNAGADNDDSRLAYYKHFSNGLSSEGTVFLLLVNKQNI